MKEIDWYLQNILHCPYLSISLFLFSLLFSRLVYCVVTTFKTPSGISMLANCYSLSFCLPLISFIKILFCIFLSYLTPCLPNAQLIPCPPPPFYDIYVFQIFLKCAAPKLKRSSCEGETSVMHSGPHLPTTNLPAQLYTFTLDKTTSKLFKDQMIAFMQLDCACAHLCQGA